MLVDSPEQGIRIFLPGNLNHSLQQVTRHQAVINMLMTGKLKKPVPSDIDNTLQEYVTEVEDRRKEKIPGNAATVVVEITGPIEANLDRHRREILDFELCMDAFDREELGSQLQPLTSAALVGLRIGTGVPCEFERIDKGVYLTDDDGKIIYSFTVTAGAVEVYTSGIPTTDQLQQAASDIALTLGAQNLRRAIKLHSQSLEERKDKLRAFLAAWNALEILVQKIFPFYRDQLAIDLRSVSNAPGLHDYLDRVADVMSGKHRLSDMFEVISVYLDDEHEQNDLKQFRKLKRIRNDILHGEDIDEAQLPTSEVQQLFDKYLRNHLRHEA